MTLPPRPCSLRTLAGCALTIGAWPRFRYDARGGRGEGRLGEIEGDGSQAIHFPLSDLAIPGLDWRTTRFLGLPLPPGLAIAIRPERLAGSLDRRSGALEMGFEARFRFTIADVYRAPDLIVSTRLTTGSVRGHRHRAEGQPLDGEGRTVLVGVAAIAPSGDRWFDRFLGLPDEALAVLRCRLGPTVEPGFALPDAPAPA